MKKKLLAMLAFSAVLAMSAGLLAACNDPKDHDDPDDEKQHTFLLPA